jgi:cell division protein FtsQ
MPLAGRPAPASASVPAPAAPPKARVRAIARPAPVEPPRVSRRLIAPRWPVDPPKAPVPAIARRAAAVSRKAPRRLAARRAPLEASVAPAAATAIAAPVADHVAPASSLPAPHRRARLPRAQRAVIVASAIVLAVGMSVAVSNASRWGRSAESFLLAEIDVVGNRVLTDGEVIGLSGLEMGTNLLTVRIDDVESAVRRSPRVHRVRASRALPNRMIVTLDETLPVALVAVGRGKAVEVSSDGVFLPAVERSAFVDLPLITGVQIADDGTPSGDELKSALDLIVGARDAVPALAAEMSEVRIAPGSGLVIYTVADGAEIRVGSGALDSSGMKRLSLVLSDLRSRGIRAESIDLRFRDQIVVKPAQDGPAGHV